MGTRQIVINVPDKVLLATKSDEATFAPEVAMLAAMPDAISNTSPLLYLYRIEALMWLDALFGEVWMQTPWPMSWQRADDKATMCLIRPPTTGCVVWNHGHFLQNGSLWI
jgi:hypothetical protein